MWSVAKRSMLVGVVCLAGASGTAYAGFSNVLEVKIPFAFVVGAQTLPAGEYRIQRDDYVPGALMIRSEHGAAASAILNTRPATEAAPKGEQPSVEFKHVENKYLLSNVWMPDGQGAAVAR